MLNITQVSLFILIFTCIIWCFYNKIDWFVFFIVLKTLHLFISVLLLHDVIIYNSPGILVSILYILCTSVLKSVIRVLLMVTMQNKSNTFFN